MNRILCAIVLLFLSVFATAQIEKKVAQYDSIINSNASDTLKSKAYARRSIILLQSNPDKSLEYAREYLNWAQRDKKYVPTANNVIGNVYYVKGEYNSALKYYLTAQSVAKELGDSLNMATAINNIGLIYINQGNLSDGLKYQLASMKIREIIGDARGVAYNYNAIAVIYKEMGNKSKSVDDFKNALKYQMKSLQKSEELKDSIGICTNTNNIGSIYMELRDMGRATEYFLKSLVLSEKINYKVGVANTLGNLGDVFIIQQLYDKAINYIERSIVIQEKLAIKSDLARNLSNLSKIYNKLKKWDKAVYYGERALSMAKENNLGDLLIELYKTLADAYSLKGDHKRANEFLNFYITEKDSLASRETRNKMEEMKARFKVEDQGKEISLLEQKQRVTQLESDKRQTIIRFTVVGIVLLFLLALLIYNRFLVKKKSNEEIKKAYKVIEEKNKDITDSMLYAARIQKSLLPTNFYIQKKLNQLKGDEKAKKN